MTSILLAREWHDAILLQLKIDRTNPGVIDRVCLVVEWPNNTISDIYFDHCYFFSCSLNFNIVAIESIRSFDILNDDPKINELKEKWMKFTHDVANIKCYRLETNSTASVISIYSLNTIIEDRVA
jgi:hypothetical protein